MPENILLISIKPEYANKIFSGEKTVELRRVRTRLQTNDLVIVYVSSPRKALVGYFKVEKVTIEENLSLRIRDFWQLIKRNACLDYRTFIKYYKGASIGVAIFIREPHKFRHPIPLEILKKEVNDFYPPQSYHYLDNEYIGVLESLVDEKIGEVETNNYEPQQLVLL